MWNALAATVTLAALAIGQSGPSAPVVAGVMLAPTGVPGAWEGNGLPADADGVAWYVGEVTLTADDCAHDLSLSLGRIDDDDVAFVNGTEIGRTQGWNASRAYAVPHALLRTGVNRIAVRVDDSGGNGGLVGDPGRAPMLTGPRTAIDLSGTWWIARGDHPALAKLDPVMDPDLRARLAPIPVGTRRTAVEPAAALTGTPPDIWYAAPARRWVEALPVGNGRLGAMVFGTPDADRLQLNEATVWEGNDQDRNAPEAAGSWRAARDLALQGKLVAAQEIIQRDCMLPGPMMPRSHQTLGDLAISLVARPDAVTGYRRSLDLGTGIARTEFAVGGTGIVRETVASAPDELLLVHTAAVAEGDVLPEMRIGLARAPFEGDVPVRAAVPGSTGARLSFIGHTGQGGVRYVCIAEIRTDGGTVVVDGGDVLVRGAHAFTVAIAARTSYGGGSPDARVDADLRNVATGWESLRQRATSWFARAMGRVKLDLGDPQAESSTLPSLLPTDRRLDRFRSQPKGDNGLVALYFRYARYLLLSSSRMGSLPANLQGIWNDHFRAPWNADFHTNINVQMNYWPAGPGALAETELPLLDLIDRLQVRGARTAKDLYGARGWCAHHITDAWAVTAPEGQTVWGMYPLGGAWLVRHEWEHYLFTGDRAFLRDRAWPAMAGAARFLLDYLSTDPATGKLVSGPSTSPENTFALPDGRHADLSMGTSMDQWIARDLLANLLDAARVLGIADDPIAVEAEKALPRLAMPAIGADGRLMEWSRPFTETEPGHRHMSHLYGLHPASFITPDGSPDLAAAARRSLERRLASGGGHTGWSRAWLINFWARLHDGERAWNDVAALLSKSTLPNLFDDHPPFQIDGNFGGAAGIGEMLLQSHVAIWSAGHLLHRVDLLPALPEAWPEGHVEGMVARGPVEVDIEWSRRRLVRAELRAPDGREIRVRLPDGLAKVRITVDGGQSLVLPVPDGIVIIPRAAAQAPRRIALQP